MSDRLLRGLSLIGVPEYHERFVHNGIDDWDRLLVTTEDELEALAISPDHRRRLLHAIAIAQLSSKEHESSTQRSPGAGNSVSSTVGLEVGDQKPSRDAKRRYRRHPKRDPNAPQVPPTAYVVFSNDFRENMPGGASFSEIAKEAGKAWQALSEEERASLREKTGVAQTRYRDEMVRYKETEDYKTYHEYWERFKAEEQERLFERSNQDADEAAARLRQEPTTSSDSGGTSSAPEQGMENSGGANTTQIAGEVLRGLLNIVPFNDEESRKLRLLLHDALNRDSAGPQANKQGVLRGPRRSLADRVWEMLGEESTYEPRASFKEYVYRQNNVAMLPLTESHVRTINPFHLQPEAKTSAFMDSFLERVNHTFFFFDEVELLHALRLAYDRSTEHSSRVMCELCLSLAIGIQWCDLGHDDSAVMWYENGRRFLDNTHWDHEPWVMRAMALIGMYHMGPRPDTAQHYLRKYVVRFHVQAKPTWPATDIGIRIARANDYYFVPGDTQQFELVELETWQRVWKTIMVIHSWLELAPSSAAFSLAILDIDPDLMGHRGLEPDSATEATTQRHMYQLSFILRAISVDVLRAENVSLDVIELHLRELETWSESVPDDLDLFRPDDFQSDEHPGWTLSTIGRTKSAKLHLVTMRLGAVIILTYPTLLQVINGLVEPENDLPGERIVKIARICVQSAYELTLFCDGMLQDGFFPTASWMTIRFVFDASMIGVLARIWQVRMERKGLADTWNSYDIPSETWLAIISSAQRAIQHCSSRNQSARLYLDNLRQLKTLVT